MADETAESQIPVIPAKAGIQKLWKMLGAGLSAV